MMKGQKLAWNIYRLLGAVVVSRAATAESELDCTALWHMQLGHISERGLAELLSGTY